MFTLESEDVLATALAVPTEVVEEQKTPLHLIEVPARARNPLERVRMVRHVDKTFGWCWEWTGHEVKGYPRVSWGGRHILVHRWVFACFVKPLKSWEEVHHRCKNRLCINPEHLEAIDPDVHTWVTLTETKAARNKEFVPLYKPMERVRVRGYEGVVVAAFKTSLLLLTDEGFEVEVDIPRLSSHTERPKPIRTYAGQHQLLLQRG